MNQSHLPAFPPKGFTVKDAQEFNDLVTKSELEELKRVREILKPYLRSIPREHKTVSQRVAYFVGKSKSL